MSFTFSKQKSKIIFLAGKTGGPFFPYFALTEKLSQEFEIVFFGIKNSFEEKIVTSQAWQKNLIYLDSEGNQVKPKVGIKFFWESKISLLSFRTLPTHEVLPEMYKSLVGLVGTFFNIILSLFWLIILRPKMIHSTGSFLTPPIFVSAKIYNLFAKLFFQKPIKLVLHQQDPMPGLANKIGVKLADLTTITTDYTKQNYPKFKDAKKIFNPVLTTKYNQSQSWHLKNIAIENAELANFLTNPKMPILLVFGGGGGARYINNWVINNLEELTKKFKVVHLTGALRCQVSSKIKHTNYFCRPVLTQTLSDVMSLSQVVLCRAGLGSISELGIIPNVKFLIPLANTHQELNAQVYSDFFYILKESEIKDWLNVLLKFEDLPQKKIFDEKKAKKSLEEYLSLLKNL